MTRPGSESHATQRARTTLAVFGIINGKPFDDTRACTQATNQLRKYLDLAILYIKSDSKTGRKPRTTADTRRQNDRGRKTPGRSESHSTKGLQTTSQA